MSADDNDMWLAVAARLLPNLDILTAHPTRQSLASLIGLSTTRPGYGSSDYERIWMTDTVELWSPITDEGMSMTPGELIDKFYKRLADLNTDMRNPRIYLVPKPGVITVDRQARRVSAVVEYANKKHFRRSR